MAEENRIRLALFDFDNTVCPGDSIVPYLLEAIRQGLTPRRQLLKAAFWYCAGVLSGHRIHNGRVKEKTLSFIRGMDRKELDRFARLFLCNRMMVRFRPEVLAEMRQHRMAGDRVLVVSASPSVYMDTITEFLPADGVLCTPCGLDDRGRYTGQIGPNCVREEKLRRVGQYLEEQGLQADWGASFAYGDSRSDIPMLQKAGHPCCVGGSKKVLARVPGARVLIPSRDA